MDPGVAPKRPRGRPPKMKRGGGGRKPNAPPAPAAQMATSSSSLTDSAGAKNTQTPNSFQITSTSETPTATPTGSKRSSPDPEEYVPRDKRSRTASQIIASRTSMVTALPTVSEAKPRNTILPARRSTRNATVQATQISEGTLRPPGPPNLEAALNIALRNLESETWQYLWTYHEKHPGGPLPTPAAVKRACPGARRAAEAVDKADRELEDAIDEMILLNSKKKGRGGVRSSRLVGKSTAVEGSDTVSNSTPETEGGGEINTVLANSRIQTGSQPNVALTPAPIPATSGVAIAQSRLPSTAPTSRAHSGSVSARIS